MAGAPTTGRRRIPMKALAAIPASMVEWKGHVDLARSEGDDPSGPPTNQPPLALEAALDGVLHSFAGEAALRAHLPMVRG